MEHFSLKQIVDIVGSSEKNRFNPDVMPSFAAVDSRKMKNGGLFFAVKGERVDGHEYISAAFKNGAVAAITEKESDMEGVITVPSTLEALKAIAKHYRSLFSVFTVGVTGSVGKTSTKEMIYSVLSQKDKTLKTLGNHNNEIGLPLTVLELNSSYRNAVFEMGMSDFGEISELSKICTPSVGVITNIGVSHMETLKSRENIMKAKLEITDGMPLDAPLILNADDDMLQTANEYTDFSIIKYGIDNPTDVTATSIVQVENETRFTISFYGRKVNTVIPTIGKHNVYNALAAFCVGLVAEIDVEKILYGLTIYQNAEMRQSFKTVNGITVIEDCYNASPDSMAAAIDVITNIKCKGKRVCVFGDMLELGEMSAQFHLEVGRMVARKDINVLLCFGEEALEIKRGAMMVGMKNVFHFTDKAELAKKLADILEPDDVVIFKASRGMALEGVISALYENWGIQSN